MKDVWEDEEVVDFLNEVLEHAPDSFDEDMSQDSIALRYVRWLEKRLEFAETLLDGGRITVNDIPWREAWERMESLLREDCDALERSRAGNNRGPHGSRDQRMYHP